MLHPNRITGSINMAILLKGWILLVAGVASGRVCACSLRSRLVSRVTSFLSATFSDSSEMPGLSLAVSTLLPLWGHRSIVYLLLFTLYILQFTICCLLLAFKCLWLLLILNVLLCIVKLLLFIGITS